MSQLIKVIRSQSVEKEVAPQVPRLTNYQRQVRAAQAGTQAAVVRITLSELQRCWRDVRIRLRRLEDMHGNPPPLAKSIHVHQDLWDKFRARMRQRLTQALLDGTITLEQLTNAYLAGLGVEPVHINTREFAAHMEDQIGLRITRVTLVTKRQVAAKIVKWYNTPGQTMKNIIQELEPKFGLDRAFLIAQTEITRLNSLVQQETAHQLNVQTWWWDTRRDSLVCEHKLKGPDGRIYKGCRELHGKVFTVGMPMPPEGSHIGCVLPGQIVAVPGLSAATKSLYKGPVIELCTIGGRRISVTPNHPVLTPTGYIAAGLLHEGDNIIAHRRPERVVSCVNPNYKHVPTVVEQVFSSLKMSGSMTTTRVPSAPKQFHGDGRFLQGDIDIVYAGRELAEALKVPSPEPVHQEPLGSGNSIPFFINRDGTGLSFRNAGLPTFVGAMGFSDLSGSLEAGHPRPLKKFGLGLTPDMNGVVDQESPNAAPRNTVFHSELVLGDAGLVEIPGLRGRQITPGRNVPPGDASLAQDFIQSGPSNMKLAHKFVISQAAFIETDQIIRVERRMYTGHVYDLQSDLYSLYTCNGIIVSNCRCNPVLVIASRTLRKAEELAKEADFEEDKHPRKSDGKFAPKGQGGGGGGGAKVEDQAPGAQAPADTVKRPVPGRLGPARRIGVKRSDITPAISAPTTGEEAANYLKAKHQEIVKTLQPETNALGKMQEEVKGISSELSEINDREPPKGISQDDYLQWSLDIEVEYQKTKKRYQSVLDKEFEARFDLRDKRKAMQKESEKVVKAANPTNVAVKLHRSFDKAYEGEVTDSVKVFNELVDQSVIPAGKTISVGYAAGRSYAEPTKGGYIVLSNAGLSTTCHEMGHWLEFQHPEIMKAAAEFRDRRAAGEKPRPLSQIIGDQYGDDEVGVADKFSNPYAGKIYPDGYTEVVSMGIQQMVTDPFQFATEDPEYFGFIWDVCHGRIK